MLSVIKFRTETEDLLTPIRTASVNDAPAIAALHVKVWQEAYASIVDQVYLLNLSVDERVKSWIARLGDPTITTIVADDNGRIAGFACGGASRDPDGDDAIGEVYSIYVDKTNWGDGTGSALFARITETLSKCGYKTATLWVLEKNTRARAFYGRKMHMDEDGERKLQIGKEEHVEIRYRKQLD